MQEPYTIASVTIRDARYAPAQNTSFKASGLGLFSPSVVWAVTSAYSQLGATRLGAAT